jgi:lysophospholipase L1-like esterase
VRLLTLLVMVPTLVSWLPGTTFGRDSPRWIGTWEASPAGLPTAEKFGQWTAPARATVQGTIRYRIRISQGGSQLRLRFSNEYGETPLTLNAVTAGRAADGLNAVPRSLKAVKFGGESTITLPVGTPAVSDAVALAVGPSSDLLVSVYLGGPLTVFDCRNIWAPHDQAVVDGIDATFSERVSAGKCLVTFRPLILEVDTLSASPREVVVALGDSRTDTFVDPQTGDRGWPGALSRRLGAAGISVINAGLSGDRLLQSMPMFGGAALARLDRDVLSILGVTHLIVAEGINDIGMSGSDALLGSAAMVRAEDMIAAYSQIATRAHAHRIKVIGSTILPFEGAIEQANYYTKEKESIRTAVNEWIRTTKVFDAVIDFDSALRDSTNPRKLNSDYSADHLHPNVAGDRRMAETIDLRLFK